MSLDDPAEAICRRMAELRRELTGDVREVSQSARAMTDWTFYVRRFPWAIVGLAAAAGFMLIPRRKEIISPDPDAIAEMVRKKQLRVETTGREKQSQGLLKSLFVMGVTWAAKSGMGYIGEQLRSAVNIRNEPPHSEPSPSSLHEPWPK